ncbi:MAG: tetratricopeptide (TPR) repeat protein [Saprospiraceae bacterium]|jgi:tetratricopeptide (TPR) repeat protein
MLEETKQALTTEQYIHREVDIFVANNNAEKKDVEHLMSFITTSGASVSQVPSLLKQGYKRLLQLRELTAQGEASIEGNKTLTQLVQRALMAASKLDYEQAAGYYEQASKFAGISNELAWGYLSQSAKLKTELGQEFGDNNALQQAIYLIEDDVLPLASGSDRAQDLATSLHLLANARAILGQRQGGTRNLEESIESFEGALTQRNRKSHPLEWAETQNSLGNSLGMLAHRQGDAAMLEKSLEAFEMSLKERTREVAPAEWASTKNNLAAVLQSMGQRDKDTQLLKKSVEIYKEVLALWTRDNAPQDWATAMNNLGTALRVLGEHRKGPRTFEQSVAAYKNALEEKTREVFPQEWAMTQNNLGAALQKLAELEKDGDTLLKAVEAYENTLQEWTRESVPMAWAMTMANLGVARRTLAEVLTDIDIARKALVELEAVSDVFRELSHAQYSELVIDQIGQTRKLIVSLESSKED